MTHGVAEILVVVLREPDKVFNEPPEPGLVMSNPGKPTTESGQVIVLPGDPVNIGPLVSSVTMFSVEVMVRLPVSVFDVSSPLLARIEGWPYLT